MAASIRKGSIECLIVMYLCNPAFPDFMDEPTTDKPMGGMEDDFLDMMSSGEGSGSGEDTASHDVISFSQGVKVMSRSATVSQVLTCGHNVMIILVSICCSAILAPIITA